MVVDTLVEWGSVGMDVAILELGFVGKNPCCGVFVR